MPASILQTKLYIPHPHGQLVARPRLLKRLDEGLLASRPLALIAAPAGYGKTTLAAAWLAHARVRLSAAEKAETLRCAWLSLDEQDNGAPRFFAYLLAAIQHAGLATDAAQEALQSLEAHLAAASTAPPAADALITALLNDLSLADGRRVVVVLDDYHRIHAPEIHDALRFWLEHAPPHLQLLLITREDPPLPLARWRVGRQMTELRAADLRFTSAEAAAFLNESMGLALSDDHVTALEARTEGWVAGLQLAALALHAPPHTPPATDDSITDSTTGNGPANVAAFIEAFSGSHYYVIDYLLEEVLRREDAAVRDFLCQTAVLSRLCAPLCDAVTGRQDGQAMLAYLERRNLFLIPLDNHRRWYRHHHLIADSLRSLLDKPTRAALHARAAQWYADNQLADEAVRHALATEDLPFAADMIEHVIQQASAWSRGHVAQLTGWLDALPAALLRARPTLSLHASRALYLAGDLRGAEQLVEQAQSALDDAAADDPGREKLRALAAVYQAAIATLRGERLRATIDALNPLVERLAATDLHAAARAADTLGLAHALLGDLTAAEAAYTRTSVLAEEAGVRYLAMNALCEVALVQITGGRLTEAEATCRAALAMTGDEAIAPAGLAWAILGEIARERNELTAAKEHIAAGIKLAQQGGIIDDLRYAWLFLAQVRQALGQADAALEAWRQADRLLQRYSVPRLTAWSAAHRTRLDLAQGNLADAERWAKRYAAQPAPTPLEAWQEFEELTLARVLWARQAEDGLASMQARVDAVLAAAESAGRVRTVIEAQLLRALILQTRHEPDAGVVASLSVALALAAPAGFVRIFLDCGPPLAALLPAAREAAPAFVDRLLSEFAADDEASIASITATASAFATHSPHLLEALSEREEEVLRLLVAGRSNQEIADALVITHGTAKWHVHNIYQKLGVNSRAAAIAQVHAGDLLD